MIYDSAKLDLPLRLRADLCVVGSGAGGMTVAALAAEAGLSVVVLEAGSFVPPEAMTQREEDMVPQLLWDNGGRTTADRGIKVIQGRALGGSTVHNINLCKRIPGPVLEHWRRTRGLSALGDERWGELFRQVERDISVNRVGAEQRNRHNELLADACRALDWAGGGLSHNRVGCTGSGFCEVGCHYDAKQNASKVFLPRAIAAGATVLTRCQAITVEHRGGTVRGVLAAALDPRTRQPLGSVQVITEHVCVSASATGTAALLLRSDVPDPGGETGRTLRIHPALVAAGEFDEPVRSWQGIPQTYECTEHLRFEDAHRPDASDEVGARTWIVPAFAHPVGTATMLPGRGTAHRQLMRRYDHMAVFTAMIHDRTAGTVNPSSDLGLSIDYWPDEADRRELLFGLAACAELLFAAGATKVIIPTDPVLELTPSGSLAVIHELSLEPGSMDITAVHPMGSVPMGDDAAVAAVDSRGRHHHVEGLYVADASLFPTSIGIPPQVATYAMGRHVAEGIVEALR